MDELSTPDLWMNYPPLINELMNYLPLISELWMNYLPLIPEIVSLAT